MHNHKSFIGLLVVLLPTACVSTGTFRAKEAQLAQAERDAADQRRASDKERNRLAGELDRVRAEAGALNRSLTQTSDEREILQQLNGNNLAVILQMKARLGALGQNIEALTQEKGALAASVNDVYARLEELRRQKAASDQRAAIYRKLVDKLHAMIAAGDLEVVIRHGRMLIVLPNDVLFDSGRTAIKAEARAALTEVAHVLASVPDRRFTVVGHTDDEPIHTARFRSNWDLSTARAVEVALFLVANGVDPATLGAAGHAEFDPVVANVPENRSKNRRVEIELEPNLAELPPYPLTGVATGP